MTLSISPYPKFRAFVSGTGTPLVGGQLYTLMPGTSGLGNLKASYTDSGGMVFNTNPVILDSNGEADVWLNGFYKLVLYDALGTLIWTEDNVSSMPSTVFSSSTTQWVDQSIILAYISATQFSTPGNLTLIFPVGTSVQAVVSAGIIYGIVTASSYGTGNTSVTVAWNPGQALDSGLSAIATGIITTSQNALPILPVLVKTGDYTFLKTDHAQIFEANKATAISFTLPPTISTVPLGWWIKIKNINVGVLTLVGDVDGVTNPTLNKYDEIIIFSDGTSFLGRTISLIGTRNFRFTIFSPLSVYSTDPKICIIPKLGAAITITHLEVTCDIDPTTEPTGFVMYADTFIGLANPTGIVAFDTTAGVLSQSTITNPNIPINKCVYIIFSASPDAALAQISFDVSYHYSG